MLPKEAESTSVIQSVSVVSKQNDAKNGGVRSTVINSSPASIGVNFYRLPPSPANLLKPDGFQFYTYNERGDMITKQMTMQEIQALIAAGGPDHSNIGIQEPQKAEDILTGGKKVMDVVEKVQSVLKSAMDKPSALTGTIPNLVPEKANVEWSNILPAILAGDKYGDTIDETHRVEEATSTVWNDPFSNLLKLNTTEIISPDEQHSAPTVSVEKKEEPIIHQNKTQVTLSTVTTEAPIAAYTEKLMIPVPVITAEHKPQDTYHTTQSSSIFQKITTETVPLENMFGESYDHNKSPVPVNAYDSATSNIFLLPIVSTKNNYDSTQLTSTTSDSKISVTEEIVPLSTTEIKTKPVDTWTNENSDANIATNPVPVIELDKTETLVNKLFTTPLHSFATFTANTDKPASESPTESSTITYDVVTKPNDMEFTQPLKPLSAELENSLSSMINQISEVPISAGLPVFSGLETPHEEITEEKRNSSEIQTSTIASVVDTTIRLSTIHKNSPLNVNDTMLAEESTVGTTTKFDVEKDKILSTVSPVFFASASTTPLEETTNYINISTKFDDTRNTSNIQIATNTTETMNTNKIFDIAVDLMPSNSSLETVDKTMTSNASDSIKTNLTVVNSNSSSTIPTAAQHSYVESMAIIEDILRTVSIEANTPVTEAVVLPNISSENIPTKTLASSLIAGLELTDMNATHDTTPLPEKVESIDVTPCSTSPTLLKHEMQTSTSILPTMMETSEHILDSEKKSSMSKNETQGASATDENLMEQSQSPNLHKEIVTLETTDGTVSVTPTNMEYSQVENNEPSTASKNTNVMSTTDFSIDSTSNDVVTDPTLNDVTDRNAFTTNIEHSEPILNLVFETTTIKISNTENSIKAEVSNISSGFQKPEQENASNTVLTKIKPEMVPRPERIPLEAFKKDDTTSVTHSAEDFVETSSTEYVNETVLDITTAHDKLSTKTNETTVVTNSSDTEKQSIEKQPEFVHVETSTLMAVSTIESLVKEKVEGQKNETNQSWKADTTTATSVDKEQSVTNAKEWTVTTTNSPTVSIKESNDKSNFDRLKNETKMSNEFHEITIKKNNSTMKPELSVTYNSQVNQTFTDVKNSSLSKVNTTDVNLDHKWQRISLHQTPSSSSTKFVAATKKPLEVSESMMVETNFAETGTRFQTTTVTSIPMNEVESTVSLNASKSIGGLDTSTRNASVDIVNFSRLCNELAFKFWIAANKGLSTGRSLALSPFGMISLLAMVFLGARGSTSDQMNEILGLDNVATFNPHLIFQNVTDAVSLARHQGIVNAAFVRELFADKVKVRKLLPFYKEQAQQFYEGLVAEVNFATISDLARRRTNLLIRKQTGGRIKDFVKSNAVPLRSPLAAISANVFQTDCNISSASTTGRDGELYFAVSSAHRLRKLIPVPATVWRSNVLAGYEPSLDATAVALGGINKLVSTIFLLPGQQGHAAPGDTLDRLEQRLVKGAFRDGSWNKLLKVLIPRPGLELQIPKFSHRSVVNATAALKRMGLDRLFTNDADFKGINGGIGNRLFLSDVLQMNLFSTCGDENVGNGRHHVEIYPTSPSLRNSRYEEHHLSGVEKKLDIDSSTNILSKNYRVVSIRDMIRGTERSEDKPRLKLDQPFLYFVRHNPTGLILHTGRFNPRLL
ncbi:uncharacterized protein LOC143146283 isoform X2 [Ptiloglossa arizonensis]|uniref:uncharacterized protein LOC143146283 isoform X2 n=1 Tax=Ptiloglossa arizonensis TaxID=3350558 RepID=UPI003F9F93B0